MQRLISKNNICSSPGGLHARLRKPTFPASARGRSSPWIRAQYLPLAAWSPPAGEGRVSGGVPMSAAGAFLPEGGGEVGFFAVVRNDCFPAPSDRSDREISVEISSVP